MYLVPNDMEALETTAMARALAKLPPISEVVVVRLDYSFPTHTNSELHFAKSDKYQVLFKLTRKVLDLQASRYNPVPVNDGPPVRVDRYEKHIVDPWPYMISSLHERVFAPRTSFAGESEEHNPYDLSNDRYDQTRHIIYHNIWRRCLTGDLAEYRGFLNSCRTVRTEFCEYFHFYMQMFYEARRH